jgi:chemotaxis signal transduction protein
MSLLPRRAPSSSDTHARSALVFRLGESRLALPADQVATVAEVAGGTPIPTADPALLGVGRVGPRLLPLIDAHRRMRVAAPPASFPRTCLVVKSPLGDVAFPIDEVIGLTAMRGAVAPLGCTLMSLAQLVDGEGA